MKLLFYLFLAWLPLLALAWLSEVSAVAQTTTIPGTLIAPTFRHSDGPAVVGQVLTATATNGSMAWSNALAGGGSGSTQMVTAAIGTLTMTNDISMIVSNQGNIGSLLKPMATNFMMAFQLHPDASRNRNLKSDDKGFGSWGTPNSGGNGNGLNSFSPAGGVQFATTNVADQRMMLDSTNNFVYWIARNELVVTNTGGTSNTVIGAGYVKTQLIEADGLNVNNLVVSNGFPAFGSDGWVQYANSGTNKAEAAFSYDDGDDTLSVTSLLAQTITLFSGKGAGKVLTDVSGNGVGVWQAPSGLLFTNRQSIAFVSTNGNDATAAVSVERLPFLTISNAIIAVRTNGGTVSIGPGRFLSPPPLLLVNDHTNNPGTNRLVIRGAGRTFATTNNDFNALVFDGTTTILEGPLWINRANVEVEDLSIDSGKVVCTNLFGGVFQGGLQWFTFQQEYWTTNTINYNSAARRVSILCYETNSATHALLFENVVDSVLEDVWTCGGVHGVVIKGFRVHARGLTAAGHTANGIIIKANGYASPAFRVIPSQFGHISGGNITIAGASINQLRNVWDTGGMRFDIMEMPVLGYLKNVNVSGYVFEGATNAVYLNSTSTNILAGIRIDCASYKDGFGPMTIATNGVLGQVYVNGVIQGP